MEVVFSDWSTSSSAAKSCQEGLAKMMLSASLIVHAVFSFLSFFFSPFQLENLPRSYPHTVLPHQPHTPSALYTMDMVGFVAEPNCGRGTLSMYGYHTLLTLELRDWAEY